MRKKTKSFALTLTTRVRAAMLLIAMLCCATGAWADEVEIGDGTSTTNYVPIGTYSNYSISEQLYTADEIGTAGTITSISFHYTGAAAKDFPIAVYMANVDAEDLESEGISLADADEVFNGTLSVPAEDGWVTIELDTPFAYDGTSNLLIGINKGWVYFFNGNTWYFTATESQMTRYNQNDWNAYDITATVPGQATNNRPNIKIEITPSGPVYKKPTDLIVSDLTSTGATISWTAPEGSPTGYAYQYKKASDADWSAETSVTATSVALSGLEPAKAYNFRVKAVYGTAGESAFTATSFTTQISDNMCSITLVLTDSYGDSWNGNSIKIVDALTGIVIGTYANENLNGTQGSGENEVNTITAPVPDDRDIRFEWVSGSYAQECSYVVYDANGEVIFEGSAAMKESVTYHVECTPSPWHKPTDLAASEIGPRSAVLSWTENSDPAATAWVVAYKADGAADFTEVNVTANPYTLEGLTPETEYTVKVRPATDEAEKWSDEITFTTAIAEAPAYAVTIDDGNVDASKWEAPTEPQKAGETVTLKYNGKKKIRSVTIEKAAAEPAGNSVDLSTLEGDYEAQNGDVLTGKTTSYKVTIAAGATVTLDGVNISSGDYCIKCLGDATIILKDGSTNTLTGTGTKYPALSIGDANTTLTIQGSTGVLNVTSGEYCAGIGGGFENDDRTCGNIRIEGGVITAQGGNSGSGIGSDCGKARCGDIIITGGTITAKGGSYAAGIGTGCGDGDAAVCGDITIANTVTKVTATAGASAPYSIGKGDGGDAYCGTITIGGTVYPNGISDSPFTYEP